MYCRLNCQRVIPVSEDLLKTDNIDIDIRNLIWQMDTNT